MNKINIMDLLCDKINEIIHIKNKKKLFHVTLNTLKLILNDLNYKFNIKNEDILIKKLLDVSNLDTTNYNENNFIANTFIDDTSLYHQQSINYHRQLIKNNINLNSIILLKTKNKFIVIDGSHRILAAYLENKPTINSYIIYL